MRRVGTPAELPEALAAAMREAEAAFGDPAVYLEQAVVDARHIEVQVLADAAGNVYVTGASDGQGHDYATIKYNASGSQIWAARYNGPGNDWDLCFPAIRAGRSMLRPYGSPL